MKNKAKIAVAAALAAAAMVAYKLWWDNKQKPKQQASHNVSIDPRKWN